MTRKDYSMIASAIACACLPEGAVRNLCKGFTRKDYTMIASAIACAHLSEGARETLVRNLCKGFREDNEKFDAVKFAEACRNDPYHSGR